MRLVLFEGPGAGRGTRPGVLTDAGVVDVSSATAALVAHSPQHLMEQIIDGFDTLRSTFERLVASALALPLDVGRLRPPLPRPGKILCCIGNYWEHDQREARPLNMFLKNPDAVIGPGDTIVLPEFTEPYMFQHEAELAIVIRGSAKRVPAADWRQAVFGFTGMIDVSARQDGRRTWRSGSWMGKSFDTFGPLGPSIVTADEIEDPNKLWVKFWNNGDLRHDYVTDDMEHMVPELVE